MNHHSDSPVHKDYNLTTKSVKEKGMHHAKCLNEARIYIHHQTYRAVHCTW